MSSKNDRITALEAEVSALLLANSKKTDQINNLLKVDQKYIEELKQLKKWTAQLANIVGQLKNKGKNEDAMQEVGNLWGKINGMGGEIDYELDLIHKFLGVHKTTKLEKVK